MPLLPQRDVARLDERFFVDAVVPALRAAGVVDLVIALSSPGAERGAGGAFDVASGAPADEADAGVVIECAAEGLEALLQGKARVEAQPAWRRKKGGSPTVVVRAQVRGLRALAALRTPSAPGAKGAARDVATEAGAVPKLKQPDRMRTAGGRYIKGFDATRRRAQPPPPPSKAVAATVAASVAAGAAAAPTDKAGFAAQNLAAFARAVLERSGDAGDDAWLVVRDGDVTRDGEGSGGV